MSSCLRPSIMYASGFNKSGKVRYSFVPSKDPVVASHQRSILVPCCKCAGCLRDRRDAWVSRLVSERFAHDSSCFLTLTYNDDNYDGRFHRDHVQRFVKRVRNLPRDLGVPSFNLRYFIVGEHGSRTGRVHYHAIFYGLDFLSDSFSPYVVSFKNQYPIYSSKVLESLWPYGYVSVGGADIGSIRYVTKYAVKGLVDGSSEHFVVYSQGLGRSIYVDVSRKGRKVFARPRSLMLSHWSSGYIVLPDSSRYSFRRFPVPRSVDAWAERLMPDVYDDVKSKRRLFASRRVFPDVSPSQRTAQIVNVFRDDFSRGDFF